MDTLLLRAFVEVAESRSFSTAAQRLHLTQPAISKRIAQLEQSLECRLFDRIGRQITLTESGTVLLPRARRVLSDMQDTERAVRDLSGSIGGPLTIATSHHIGLHRLPPLLRDYARRHAAVSLDIAFMDSEQAHDAVVAGRTELAIITLAPTGTAPQLQSREVWPDPLSVMVARDHPLAGVSDVPLRRLGDYPAVLPGSGTYTGQILEDLFRRHGIPLRVSMSTNYLETLRMLAAIGLGWSLLPHSMLTDELVALDLDDIRIERSLGYVYHRERSLSNAARALIAMLDVEAERARDPVS